MSPFRLLVCALCISSALLFLQFTSAAAGTPASPTEVSSLPAWPRPGEPVELAIGGLWSDACVPEYGSHQIEGMLISVVLTVTAEICGQVETPWRVTVELGALDAGSYNVAITGALEESDTLLVAKEFWYLPTVAR